MIYDKIENLGKYPILSQVKNFLEEHKGHILADGKYILNENCYLAVSEYKTGDGNAFEAHKEYIDVQILAKGREYILVQNIQAGKPITEYDEEKDIIFYSVEEFAPVVLDETFFLLLDVDDLHKPAVKIDESTVVKKYVFKIKRGI